MTSRLYRRLVLGYGPAMALSNVVGAAVVYVFLAFLYPHGAPGAAADRQLRLNTYVTIGYLAFALSVGTGLGIQRSMPLRRWLLAGRPPTEAERLTALRLPLRQLAVHAGLWLLAAVVYALVNLGYDHGLAAQIALTIVLGGVTTSALGYLVAERLLRPLVREALLGAPPPEVVLSVGSRLLLAWALGTGVPLLGIGIGALGFGGRDALGPAPQLFLVGIGLLVGALGTLAAAGAVSDPVRAVAAALVRVGGGDLDSAVPVDDASEVGQLQAGFNSMVQGLRERRTLEDLYGRQVGTDVAALALADGVRLGGELREVVALFVDVVGSTGLAERLGPEVVVEQLNAFFAVVVESVTAEGGWVNKFEGDAALCVFGAPSPLPDAASHALAAARALCEGLLPLPLSASIGVAAGPVVAGHVGAESRFEYTVIGDPVNSAARLAGLASERGGLLAGSGVVQAASPSEQSHWAPDGEVVLRGRSSPTELYRPR